MTSQKVTFANSQNETLSARLVLPVDRKPLAYAVFAHCFTCTKDSKAASRISRTLAQQGIAVLRFDFTGLGASAGDFAATNLSTNVDDLAQAAAYLERNHAAPALLIGHSLGGAAALLAAADIASVRAVIAIAAPADPEHVVTRFRDRKDEIIRTGEAEVDLGGRPFRVRKQFLDDLRETRLLKVVSTLKKPLLIMHSPFDKVVSIDHAGRIFKAAKHPKSFLSLDSADHLLAAEEDAVYAGNMAAAWACRFLATRRPDSPVTATDNSVVVRLEQGFRTDIIANGHPLVADEPVAVGGTNAGPSPYDLLVAGLGACTAMTLRMYADHKKLPLEAVTLKLTHEKIHAVDCENCETENGKIDRIGREIELAGELTDEQRQRMLEIADRCPVHKTLHAEVDIVTRLKQG